MHSTFINKCSPNQSNQCADEIAFLEKKISPQTCVQKIELISLTKHRISYLFYYDGLTFFIIPTSAVSFS